MLVATLIGMCIGSFLNVVIYRLPLMLDHAPGITLNKPASSCPCCTKPIRWYDNIPVLSWINLKGQCRDCNVPISLRYPTIELIGGLLAYYSYLYAGLSVTGASLFITGCGLLTLTLISFDKAPNNPQ